MSNILGVCAASSSYTIDVKTEEGAICSIIANLQWLKTKAHLGGVDARLEERSHNLLHIGGFRPVQVGGPAGADLLLAHLPGAKQDSQKTMHPVGTRTPRTCTIESTLNALLETRTTFLEYR